MSRHSIVRGRGVDYITSGREAGDDAADNLSHAAWCARNMVDHYQQRSMSEERDLWAAEYRELAEYLEASHARLLARRAAADVVDEPPARQEPATYDCPCGLHIVDWSDDVEGFHEGIADHEATCDGLNEFERERERVDVDEPAPLAAELALLNGEHRALLGPVDRTGARDETELARFMARCKNLDAREAQLRTAHFPDAATLAWQAGTWFTCDQHGENHRTVWTEQDGLVDDIVEPERCVHGELTDRRTRADRPVCAICRHAEDRREAISFTCPRCEATSWNPNDAAEGYCARCHAWTGSQFAPPAGQSWAAGGKIPDVTPVTLECPGRDGFAHDWDDSYDCLACDAEQPVTMRYPRRGFSQAGLMSLVGAR
jgi:hypothetical protein